MGEVLCQQKLKPLSAGLNAAQSWPFTCTALLRLPVMSGGDYETSNCEITMPLKLRIKPEGKLFVSGTGWIKNVGNRPMDVIVSEGMNAEREKRIEAQKTTIEGLDL